MQSHSTEVALLMQDNLRLMQDKLRLMHGAMIHGAINRAAANGVHGALTHGGHTQSSQEVIINRALMQADGALMHQALMGGTLTNGVHGALTDGAVLQEALIRRALMQTDGAPMHHMGGALTVIGSSSKECLR